MYFMVNTYMLDLKPLKKSKQVLLVLTSASHVLKHCLYTESCVQCQWNQNETDFSAI